MANRNFKVTIEEEYPAHEGWVRMRYGSTEAQIPDAMNSDDYVIDMQTRQPRIIPGKPIVYSLNLRESPEIMMPEDAVKHLFGNFDIPSTNEGGSNPNEEMTFGYEKRRVTLLWGGYVRRTRDRNVGNDWRSLENIAPPPVPHVRVELIGNNLKVTEGFLYRPWDSFAWQKDCVENVWDTYGRRRDVAVQPIPALIGGGMTAEQIETMVNKLVADKLADAKGRVKASA